MCVYVRLCVHVCLKFLDRVDLKFCVWFLRLIWSDLNSFPENDLYPWHPRTLLSELWPKETIDQTLHLLIFPVCSLTVFEWLALSFGGSGIKEERNSFHLMTPRQTGSEFNYNVNIAYDRHINCTQKKMPFFFFNWVSEGLPRKRFSTLALPDLTCSLPSPFSCFRIDFFSYFSVLIQVCFPSVQKR